MVRQLELRISTSQLAAVTPSILLPTVSPLGATLAGDNTTFLLCCPGLLYAQEAQAEVTFGLLSSQNNSTLADFSLSGQWDLFNLYQPENDIPAQRAVLEELYIATQGQNWSPGAYFSTVPLEEIEEFAYYYANYSGRLPSTTTGFYCSRVQ